jgi:hypothetical protein
VLRGASTLPTFRPHRFARSQYITYVSAPSCCQEPVHYLRFGPIVFPGANALPTSFGLYLAIPAKLGHIQNQPLSERWQGGTSPSLCKPEGKDDGGVNFNTYVSSRLSELAIAFFHISSWRDVTTVLHFSTEAAPSCVTRKQDLRPMHDERTVGHMIGQLYRWDLQVQPNDPTYQHDRTSD